MGMLSFVAVGRRVRVVAALAFAALAGAASAQLTGTAVEYYHAAFDHYFATSAPNEIADLDSGKYGDAWKRTGLTFPVWTQPDAGTSATCRFFSDKFPPISTHFYTPRANVCTLLLGHPLWQYEGIAFHLKVDALGNCPVGTLPLYCLYNNAKDLAPNHRYTTSRAAFDQMVAQGWTAEGAGPLTAYACVPAVASPDPAGYWQGTTNAGEQVVAGTFADGSFFLFFGSETSMGVVDGQGTYGVPVLPIPAGAGDGFGTGISFAAPQAQLILMEPVQTSLSASVAATIVPQGSIQGSISSAGLNNVGFNRTFTATYAGPVVGPVAPAQLAGTYDGVAATARASIDVVFTVSATGAIAAQSGSCAATGTVVPRGITGLLDASIAYGGVGCSLGQGATTGLGFYDPELQALLLVTRSASDWFVFGGMK